MNVIIGIAVIGLIRIIALCVNSKNETDNHRLKYQCDRIEMAESLISKYYTTLELNPEIPLTPCRIQIAHKRMLAFIHEDIKLGYKPIHSIRELEAAKAYLTDWCHYAGCMN